MIHIGIGEYHALNGTVAQTLFRVQDFVAVYLLAQIRGGIEQKPALTIGTDCNGGLRAWRGLGVIAARPVAVGMIAIPLGETATGGGA